MATTAAVTATVTADAERLRAEKLAALKADIAIGLQQADAGLLVDGETALRALHAKHFPGRK